MKKVTMVILLVILMVFGGTYLVKSESFEIVQGVLNEIQQVTETKEEITKEVNNIEGYLEEMQDITVKEQQVMETIYELAYGDNKFIRVVQGISKFKEDRDASIRYAKELVEGYTKYEKKVLYEFLNGKKEADRTEEENILLDVIKEDFKEDFNDKYRGTNIKVSLTVVIVGIFLMIVDVKYSKSNSMGFYGYIGTVLFVVGLTIGLLLIVG